jgi:hypothetical protein
LLFSAFVHLAAAFTVDFAARPAVLGGCHVSKTVHPSPLSLTPFLPLLLGFLLILIIKGYRADEK